MSTEDQVAAVWRELLELDTVPVDEDFFALGGHSMLAVQVLHRLTELTGLELELEDFFELGTVAEVAAELDRLRAARPAAEPVFEGEL
ncbi:phosphopantetheine-binding protein [Streptomyces sp. CA-179760]|uniref:phosphopantetheine-binding protein n=1 Tax=Streptomyces sp. CA-179760 TaxID=3240054 RepID=UPI003D8A8E6B